MSLLINISGICETAEAGKNISMWFLPLVIFLLPLICSVIIQTVFTACYSIFPIFKAIPCNLEHLLLCLLLYDHETAEAEKHISWYFLPLLFFFFKPMICSATTRTVLLTQTLLVITCPEDVTTNQPGAKPQFWSFCFLSDVFDCLFVPAYWRWSTKYLLSKRTSIAPLIQFSAGLAVAYYFLQYRSHSMLILLSLVWLGQ